MRMDGFPACELSSSSQWRPCTHTLTLTALQLRNSPELHTTVCPRRLSAFEIKVCASTEITEQSQVCNLSQSPEVWPTETTNKGKWVRVSSKAQDSACLSGRNHCCQQKFLDCSMYTLESNMAVNTESSKNLKVRLLTWGHIRTMKGRQEVRGMKFLVFPIF